MPPEDEKTQLPLFEAAELGELSAGAPKRSLKKGEAVWTAGSEPQSVWVVQSGRVNVGIDTHDGGNCLVQFCTRGQGFCPGALIAGTPYPCSAVAATDAVLSVLPRSKVMAYFKRVSPGIRKLITQMSGMLCQAHLNQAMSLDPVKSRMASLLLRLDRQFRHHDLPFNRKELASMSGMTVETASRTLSVWEKSGLIQSRRGALIVKSARDIELAGN